MTEKLSTKNYRSPVLAIPIYPPKIKLHKQPSYASKLTMLLSESILTQPLSHKESFRSALSTYFLALTITEEAISHFRNKNYRFFDALIGNNSCYIVAYHIFCLSMRQENGQTLDEPFLTNQLKLIKTRIVNILSNIDSHFHPQQTFIDFLKKNDLVNTYDTELIYLTLCFGCAIAKTKNCMEYEEIDYNRLLKRYEHLIYLGITKKSATKLIKHWQRIASHINVKSLQSQVTSILTNSNIWNKYLNNEYVAIDCRARLCLPSFYSLKAIYNLLLMIPDSTIGLQVNLVSQQNHYMGRRTIYFRNRNNKTFSHIEKSDIKSRMPIYIFAGCRHIDSSTQSSLELIETSFAKRNVSDIIFAHEATYPQYPISLQKKDIIPNDPGVISEINRLKQLRGCSLKDPSDFCTVHVYVDNFTTQESSFLEPPIYLPNLCDDQRYKAASN